MIATPKSKGLFVFFIISKLEKFSFYYLSSKNQAKE